MSRNARRVECLSAFNELSPKGRAFVLASTLLYIYRSENPKFGEKESLRPLSPDEKSVFLQIVQKCLEDGSMVFELTDQMDEEQKLKRLMEIATSENYSNSKLMEWRKTFREEALAFQRELGDQNPFYPLSLRTEKMWRQVCDESPVAIVYAILAMETRLDFAAIDLPIRNANFQKSSSAPEDDATDRSVSQGIQSSKIDAMRRYLHLQVALQARESSIMGPYLGDRQGIPEPLKEIKPQRLSDIAREVVDLFPEMKEGKIPRFSEKNYAAITW